MSPRNGKLGVYFPKPIKKCIALFFTAVIHMHVHTPQYIETPYNRQKKIVKTIRSKLPFVLHSRDLLADLSCHSN